MERETLIIAHQLDYLGILRLQVRPPSLPQACLLYKLLSIRTGSSIKMLLVLSPPNFMLGEQQSFARGSGENNRFDYDILCS